MSVPTAGANKDEGTLEAHRFQDDSLCTDEFEIISSDTLDNGDAGNDDETISQWTTKHSINVESTIPMNNLAHILCSTHSDVPSVISGSSFKSATETLDGETNRQKNNHSAKFGDNNETGILAGTMQSSIAESTLIDASSFSGSDNTLDNVIRSQSETREMLEKAIISLDSMNRERSEITSKFATINTLEDEIASLKARVADLEQENIKLKQQNSKEEQVIVDEQKSKETNMEGNEAVLLKEQLSLLQQQLYDRGLEVDRRTKALTEITGELEAAHRKISDLTDSNNSAMVKCKDLSDKLDETFALLLAERERVSVAEDEVRSLSSVGGEGFNFSMVNEHMVAREMREKAAYAQKLETELEETKKRLNDLIKCCDGKDDELRTHMEIINVLKEEDGEGRREIAERDRRIKELEDMVQEMCLDRAEVNNC